ncbi:MAG: ActS/PrrB/RegB family redox-sensitive histidine kinase [Rhodospirillales bacterium]|nr:ActS/PrrB/RegB family redox-sensitive histidine kinase [Alphaproteobacteria bacterium]MCB9987497.1 ActS/PrrB/RegB family redox-sensitive histidine kinase [Rhodospirillales bacterium]USO07529.1 MAG: ActS/PrrB/RegB family redox-sensitive histidine kinase [Rhodospirillales bacterium]
MSIDIHARVSNVVTTPMIILRWIISVAQLLVVLGSDALFGIPLPAPALSCLIGASFAINIYAMKKQQRRQLSENIVLWYFIFDISQFCGFLFFTGGTENPFSVFLLAPLAMAASLLSLFSLCLLIMLTVLGVSILSFAYIPLEWPDPQPVFSPAYQHGTWVALMVSLVFISFTVWRLAMETRRVTEALVTTRSILEQKRRMSALGALAAAAVHELGSPLGTIAVVTKEMEIDLLPDDPLAEDVAILRDQTEKCKKILADLASNPDRTLAETTAPMRLDRMLMEIASAFDPGDGRVRCTVVSRIPENLPVIGKTLALEYGIGNLIGNAMSYARSAVEVEVEGDADAITLNVRDDGPGFGAQILQTVGQPYISTRDDDGTGHMGLGIFISINLLEGTGAKLRFNNALPPKTGATVQVIWPRWVLEGNEEQG